MKRKKKKLEKKKIYKNKERNEFLEGKYKEQTEKKVQTMKEGKNEIRMKKYKHGK